MKFSEDELQLLEDALQEIENKYEFDGYAMEVMFSVRRKLKEAQNE